MSKHRKPIGSLQALLTPDSVVRVANISSKRKDKMVSARGQDFVPGYVVSAGLR